ncbi:MAG: hypothetical protein HY674_12255 [Chloroflexi bacterium]|nr:hypothetical protein [Chloroflexota bacterium]
MKPLHVTIFRLAAIVVAAALFLGCEAENEVSNQPAPTNYTTASTNSAALAQPAGATNTSITITPPPNIHFSDGVAEVLKVAQSGVGDAVALAFIESSTKRFDLGAEEIVYLNDIGISPAVIAAMLNHDKSAAGLAETLQPPTATNAVIAAQPAPAQPESVLPPTVPDGVAAPAPAPSPYANLPVAETPPTASAAEAPPAQVVYTTPQVVYVTPPAQVSYNSFYSSLAPYGSWIEVGDYGWCWQPTISVLQPTWRPYGYGGRWLYTDCGWYWQSDYSWGWAPFHYGRWQRHAHHGWLWTPDLVWGPAWVSWRHAGSYCGWAPLPPSARYTYGVGFSYFNNRVGVGFDFGLASDCYTFMPIRRFCDRDPWHYYLPHSQGVNIYKNSTVVNNYINGDNNTVINEGVGRNLVAGATRSEIRKVAIRDLPASGGTLIKPDRLEKAGNDLVLYRPKPVVKFAETSAASRSLQELPKAALESAQPKAPSAIASRMAGGPGPAFNRPQPVPSDQPSRQSVGSPLTGRVAQEQRKESPPAQAGPTTGGTSLLQPQISSRFESAPSTPGNLKVIRPSQEVRKEPLDTSPENSGRVAVLEPSIIRSPLVTQRNTIPSRPETAAPSVPTPPKPITAPLVSAQSGSAASARRIEPISRPAPIAPAAPIQTTPLRQESAASRLTAAPPLRPYENRSSPQTATPRFAPTQPRLEPARPSAFQRPATTIQPSVTQPRVTTLEQRPAPVLQQRQFADPRPVRPAAPITRQEIYKPPTSVTIERPSLSAPTFRPQVTAPAPSQSRPIWSQPQRSAPQTFAPSVTRSAPVVSMPSPAPASPPRSVTIQPSAPSAPRGISQPPQGRPSSPQQPSSSRRESRR